MFNFFNENFIKKERISVTRNIFLRGLSLIYLFAFLSIFYQIQGLWGDNGIFPAYKEIEKKSKFLEENFKSKIHLTEKLKVLQENPNIFTISIFLLKKLNEEFPYKNSIKKFNVIINEYLFQKEFSFTQNFMFLHCLISIILSLLIFLNIFSQIFYNPWSYFYLWFVYSSFVKTGENFMSFQWDIFLIEIGFLSIFFCPFSIKGKNSKHKISSLDIFVYYLLRFMLFRFIYANGIVKVTADCPTWQSLTSLNHHFQSQPIPNIFSWYAHFSPDWLKKIMVAFTFFIEIHSTFLFFSFRIKFINYFAGILQISLQIGIILTGNYNFFNLLTILLIFMNFDDDFFDLFFIKGNKKNEKNENSLRKLFDFLVNNLFYLIITILICFSCIFPLKEILFNKNYRYKTNDLKNIFNKNLTDKYIFIIFCFIICVFLIEFIKENFHPIKIKKAFFNVISESKIKIPFLFSFKLFNFLVKLFAVFFLSFNFWYSTKIFYNGIGLRPNSIKEGFFNYLKIPKFGGKGNFENIVIENYNKAENIFQNLNTNYSYGLFRVMTGIGSRPELEIYFKSKNLKNKKKINFLYKQSYDKNLKLFNIPHQPRIDWQMWFAALSSNINTEPWLIIMLGRIFEKNPYVLDLLGYEIKDNPIRKSNILFKVRFYF